MLKNVSVEVEFAQEPLGTDFAIKGHGDVDAMGLQVVYQTSFPAELLPTYLALNHLELSVGFYNGMSVNPTNCR